MSDSICMSRRAAFHLLRRSLLLSGILLIGEVDAADMSHRFELKKFSREDGLPHEVVECIEQTAEGFMWFGTQAGLCRYDGKRFTSFTRANVPAFSETDCVIELAVDEMDGSLWAGLRKGLAHYKEDRWTFHGKEEGLPETGTWGMAAVPTGGVWGMMDGGPHRIRPDGRIQFAPPNATNFPSPCVSISYFAEGELLVNQKEHYYLHKPMQRVTTPLMDAEGSRIMGSQAPSIKIGSATYFLSGTNVYRHVEKTTPVIVRSIDSNPGFKEFALGNDGTIWLEGNGLYFQETNGLMHTVYPAEFQKVHVTDLKCDGDGNLWASSKQGVFFLQPKPYGEIALGKFKNRETTPLTVAVRKGGGLAAGFEGGYALWENENATPAFKEIGSGSVVRLIAELNQNQTVIVDGALGGETYLLEGDTHRPIKNRHFGYGLNAVIISTNESWALHNTFLSHTNKDGVSFYSSPVGFAALVNAGFDTQRPARIFTNSLPHVELAGLIARRDGGVWFGSKSEGLFRLKDDQIKRWGRADGLPSNYVAPGLEEEDGTLWVLTDRGLARLRHGTFSVISIAEGLEDGPVFALAAYGRESYLMATRHGMFLVDRKNLHKAADRTATLLYRLIGPVPEGNGFSVALARDGSIYYPSRNKIIRLRAENERNAISWPPYVDTAVIDGREMIASMGRSQRDVPTLGTRGIGLLKIGFGVCDFSGRRERKLRYRLKGHSDSWMETTENSAYFVNLRPGKYQFEIAALNGAGKWGEPVVRTVSVAPFFYQTAWFKGAVVFLLIAAAFAVHRRRLQLYRELSVLREEAALQGERNRIARDMHDSMGSKLTKAALQASAIERGEAGEITAAKPRVSDSIRDAIREMDEIVWLLDSENNDLGSTINYLARDSADLLDGTPLRLWQNIPEQAPGVPVNSEFQRDLIFVVREALNNAAKHSVATQIWFTIEIEADMLRVRIEDDGVGLGKSGKNEPGNGLRNMTNRLRRHGGRCTFTNRDPRGFVVLLELPISMESNDGKHTRKN